MITSPGEKDKTRNKSICEFSYKTIYQNPNYHIVGIKEKGRLQLEVHPNKDQGPAIASAVPNNRC